jgi:hypothetical protein
MQAYVFVASEYKPSYRAWPIMFWLKRSYSHAGILLNSTVYHATRHGVIKENIEKFMKTDYFVHLIDVSDYLISTNYAKGWCEGSLGKDYSESQLFALVFKFLRKVKIMSDGKSEMICSEFTARFVDECTKIPIFDKVNKDFISPSKFIEVMLAFQKKQLEKAREKLK